MNAMKKTEIGGRVDARLLRLIPMGEREEWPIRFANCQPVRELLVRVLTAEIESDILRVEAEALDSPNALAAVAASIGYRKGLRHAIRLISSPESTPPHN